MPLWGTILITVFSVLALFFIFLGAPALVIYFSVFGRKKAPSFEQYDQEKFKKHYYYPYVNTIYITEEISFSVISIFFFFACLIMSRILPY